MRPVPPAVLYATPETREAAAAAQKTAVAVADGMRWFDSRTAARRRPHYAPPPLEDSHGDALLVHLRVRERERPIHAPPEWRRPHRTPQPRKLEARPHPFIFRFI